MEKDCSGFHIREIDFSRDITDILLCLCSICIGIVLIDLNRTGIRFDKTHNLTEQCCLASAVFSGDSKTFPF